MELLTTLGEVRWTTPAALAETAARSGVKLGFCGKNAPPPACHHARQVHGTRLAMADSNLTGPETSRRVEADGVVTFGREVAVAVKTADCLPVLIWAPGTAAIAVHAGWRGLAAGIIGDAVSLLAAKGTPRSKLHAVVGPAISRERFEVGLEVIEALNHGALGLTAVQAALCTGKGVSDRWHFDLPLAAVCTLLNSELAAHQIGVAQTCTVGGQAWHSFRRDGKGHGSNWSWISLV